MLKTLIKKQFMELFRQYFVNQKTGQPRTRGKIIGLFIGFAALIIFSSAMFVLLSMALAPGLIEVGMDWLYFTLMGIISILLGTFGSVFNTYAGLYRAKDNDLLISMPIPPSRILLARVSGVLGLSLLYSGMVWIPACICYWIAGSPSIGAIILEILLLFVISLFVSVLTCILGWLVALIAGKLKNRSFLIVLLSLIFIGLYYFFCFRMTEIMQKLLMNAEAVGGKVKIWLNIFYQMGHAAVGELVPMLIFTGITLALCAVCYYVLSRSFIYIATNKTSEKKAVYVEKTAKKNSISTALLKRELKHFTSNPTYMLNCGLGIIFMIALPVLLIVNRGDVQEVQEMFFENVPFIKDYLPIALAAALSMLLSMDLISTPSISLEGKSLWILQSLPVETFRVLEAKVVMHFWINEIPAVLSTFITGIVLELDGAGMIQAVLIVSLVNLFIAELGLILGLKRPNFTWTSEMQPIKQSTNILIMMIAGWALTAAIAGLYFLVKNFMSVHVYAVIWIVLLAIVNFLMQQWLKTGGARTLEAL